MKRIILILCAMLIFIVGCKEEPSEKVVSLKKVFRNDFPIGVALSNQDLQVAEKTTLVREQFASITCENEMKPDFLLDYSATLSKGDEAYPVVNMERAIEHLEFAKENNMKMRGHTLVWHSQTPRWFFTVGYEKGEEAQLVDRETMKKRMENYIKQVLEYTASQYPGIIYAWDVVNEAIEPSNGHEQGIRTENNLWYETLGEDYVTLAFTYARKYAAAEEKLFYNDYGTYDKNKMFHILHLLGQLKEENLIDGVGMQDHMNLQHPTTLDYQYAINKYAELDIEIQVTELDIDTDENTEEAQKKLAIRYKNIMTLLRSMKEKKLANITGVTFWGLSDDRSWLNKENEPSYPLLFDKNLHAKPAYYGAILDESIPAY